MVLLKKGQEGPGWIIVLVLMILIVVAFWTFLSQLAGGAPLEKALNDVKESIETVCQKPISNYKQGFAVIPEGNKIELEKLGGVLNYMKDSNVLAKKTLECPENTVFSNCVIGPTKSGWEGVVFGVNKTINITTGQAKITLNGTNVTCSG